jgi:pimeloyl-ACP methyl ester carboxylesterase
VIQAASAGRPVEVPYTLDDMADDTVALMTELGIDRAHLVGASMGGMIAQTIAIEHPSRVRSLTSIMSSTGSFAVGQPQPHVWPSLGGPPPTNREQAIERAVAASGVIGSPGFPRDLDMIRERAGIAYDRGFDPPAFARQGIAVLAPGDRTAPLRLLDLPALVIHGAADPLVDVSGGRATAAAIPGAELLVIEGMGHDLPRGAWSQIVPKIVETVERGEARREKL